MENNNIFVYILDSISVQITNTTANQAIRQIQR